MKFLVVFALACALNVGVVLGYEPWAENLDKHESEWRVLKFYPEFFPNAEVTPEGRVVNDYGRDVTYDYVKTAMQSISLLRRNYQTYTPEKAKEDAETLFEVLNGLEEYSFLWEVTTPDPVWYTTPAPGPRYKLATEISIEDLVADALRHDFYVNGVGVPRGFAENAFEAPTTPTAILKTTESTVESSTTKELSNEESNAAFKAEENHKETTDSREIDLEVTTNEIESVSKLEVTEKPTKVFKLHEDWIPMSPPHSSRAIHYPSREADDKYFHQKPLEHTEREITWAELSKALGLNRSSLGPVVKRSKRQVSEDFNRSQTIPRATPYSGSATSDDQDIEKAFDEGKITLEEYGKDFLAFIQQSKFANVPAEDASPMPVEEDFLPFELEEPISVPFINTEDLDVGRTFQQDDYLAAIFDEDIPSPKSTSVPDVSNVNEQEGKAIEEHLKSSDDQSSTPIVAETSNVRDIEREYDEGKITLKEYTDYFVTVVQKNVPVDKSTDTATLYDDIFAPTVSQEESLPIRHSADVTISGEPDVEKAFDEGKITFEEYTDHFLTSVEKQVPADKSSPSTASVVEEEPLPSKPTEVSSTLSKAFADLSDFDVDQEIEKIFLNENVDQLDLFGEQQAPTDKSTSSALEASPLNRGRLSVDDQTSTARAIEASFVPVKESRKMMEKMMTSFGLTRDDLHEILVNVKPLWETDPAPKSQASSDDSRVSKVVTTDAPIHKTTSVPSSKVNASVSPMAKVIVSSARDFAAEYKAGKITKSEYVNLVISSIRTKSPIAPATTSRPKTLPKTTTTSRPITTSQSAIPTRVQSKNVVQLPVIVKTPLPTSIFSIFDTVTPNGVGKKTVLSKTNSPLFAVFKKAPSPTIPIRKEVKHVKNPNPFFATYQKTSTSRKSASGSKVPKVSGSAGNPLFAVFKKPSSSTRIESTPVPKHESAGIDGNPLYAVFKRPTASGKTSSAKVTSETEQPWVSVDQDEFKYWKSAPISNLVDVVYGEAKPVFDKDVKSVPYQSRATAETNTATNQQPVTISYTKSLPKSFPYIVGANAKKPSYEIHYHSYNVQLPHHVASPFIQKLYHGLRTQSKK
ncbi:hypothetical protein TCAL_04951, partial [Tigriopus californicus]